ncbi:zinc-dependent alcohol dehydrogenase [Rhodotorula paludigena]|uniref:zinc-dependent alcohol dehydrogenase n=1 Tax=Rhodotorula paludigena TaxID=86838 RepID=UPI0031828074
MNMAGSTLNVPKTCRAAVCRNPGPNYSLELVEDYPVPSPGPGQLLLKINATGLCLSDHHNMTGDIGIPMMCDASGHEGAGVVVALGEGVQDWKVGDRAGIKPLFDVCHECAACRGGDEGLCPKLTATGAFSNGSYCEYIVSPARYTTRIPDGVPDKYAAPLMCSGTTIYTAIKRSGIRAGQWLVLPGGGGGVGHLGITYAKVQGIRPVVIDTGAEKRALCERLGCEAFVDFKECKDPAEEVKRITGGGGHVVIVTGGTAAAYSSAPAYLRPGGTMICVGLPSAGTAIAGADPCAIIFKKLTIRGSLTGNQVDADEALDFVRRGLVEPHVTVRPFSELKAAFADLLAAKVAGRMVIDFTQ